MVFALALLTACSGFCADALVNGGFEDGLDGWIVDGAELSTESVDGELSAMVRLEEPAWKGVSQILSVPASVRAAKVAGWLRADSVRGGKESWERGRLSVEFQDASGGNVGGHLLAIGQVRGRQPWTRVSRVVPVPAGARALKVECALGNSTGTLRCDGISVEFME